MKKILAIICAVILAIPSVYSQTVQSDAQQEEVPENKVETKFDKFVSSYGTFVQFAEYNLPNLKLDGGWINYTKIRVFTDLNTNSKTCFLRLRSGYANRIESIAYEDLVKILEAIPKLKEIASTAQQQGEYMETFVRSEDGFKIGFYMENNKITWYLTIDYQTRTFKKDFDFESAFVEAKNKMEDLMK